MSEFVPTAIDEHGFEHCTGCDHRISGAQHVASDCIGSWRERTERAEFLYAETQEALDDIAMDRYAAGRRDEREEAVSYLTTDRSRGLWTWESDQHPLDTIAEALAGGKHAR